MITQIAIAASQQATAADQSSSSLDFILTLSNDNLSEMATTITGIESLRAAATTLESHVEALSAGQSQPAFLSPKASHPGQSVRSQKENQRLSLSAQTLIR